FSMDEYNGYFRIATTTGQLWWSPEQATSKNHVYVLNMDLNVTGKIEDIAPGESIYSARFMGERCYLVTFKKVDPFFVIDLSDPANPKILGKLKITGYSDYLHPYDENHIIGIGKEAVEAEEGDFAWYQGVKISLFDVSDVENPVEIGKYEIGDRGTDSPILWDHKALLFDKERNLLAIPVLVAEINEKQYPGGVPPNTYGDYVWQGVYVFNVSADALTLRGRIAHAEVSPDLLKSGYYFDSSYEVKRSLYIDDVLYTVSDKKVKMNNLENLEVIGEIELP
nr:beta-propeller domain-containing protein [Candidatus Njordarchaeum guaymaensis]